MRNIFFPHYLSGEPGKSRPITFNTSDKLYILILNCLDNVIPLSDSRFALQKYKILFSLAETDR